MDSKDFLIINGSNLTFDVLRDSENFILRNEPDLLGQGRPLRAPINNKLTSDQVDDNFRKLRDAGRNVQNISSNVKNQLSLFEENYNSQNTNFQNLSQRINSLLDFPRPPINGDHYLTVENGHYLWKPEISDIQSIVNPNCIGLPIRITTPFNRTDICVQCCNSFECDPTILGVLPEEARLTCLNVGGSIEANYNQFQIDGCGNNITTIPTQIRVPVKIEYSYNVERIPPLPLGNGIFLIYTADNRGNPENNNNFYRVRLDRINIPETGTYNLNLSFTTTLDSSLNTGDGFIVIQAERTNGSTFDFLNIPDIKIANPNFNVDLELTSQQLLFVDLGMSAVDGNSFIQFQITNFLLRKIDKRNVQINECGFISDTSNCVPTWINVGPIECGPDENAYQNRRLTCIGTTERRNLGTRWINTISSRCANNVRFLQQTDYCGNSREIEDGTCDSCSPWQVINRVCEGEGIARLFEMRTCDGVRQDQNYTVVDLSCGPIVCIPTWVFVSNGCDDRGRYVNEVQTCTGTTRKRVIEEPRWRFLEFVCIAGIRYRREEDICGLLPMKETEDGICSCTPWEITHRVCVSLGYRRVYVMRTCDGGVVEYDDYLISDIGCNDPLLPPPDTL